MLRQTKYLFDVWDQPDETFSSWQEWTIYKRPKHLGVYMCFALRMLDFTLCCWCVKRSSVHEHVQTHSKLSCLQTCSWKHPALSKDHPSGAYHGGHGTRAFQAWQHNDLGSVKKCICITWMGCWLAGIGVLGLTDFLTYSVWQWGFGEDNDDQCVGV